MKERYNLIIFLSINITKFNHFAPAISSNSEIFIERLKFTNKKAKKILLILPVLSETEKINFQLIYACFFIIGLLYYVKIFNKYLTQIYT